MIYHYFGGKEKLYVEVLEHVLARLREAELAVTLDVQSVDPSAGILQLYDFHRRAFLDASGIAVPAVVGEPQPGAVS